MLSADKENDPDVVGINAAAAALALSDIPFGATVGAVRVGRVNGEFVVNPTYAERAATTVNIMVVGHKDGIVMIESGAKEETEEVILAAIEFAHEEIKKIVAAIDELVGEGRQEEARIHAAGVGRGVLRGAEGQDRRTAERCAGHQEAREDGELCADRRDQEGVGGGIACRRPGCEEEARRTITSICASGCSASR